MSEARSRLLKVAVWMGGSSREREISLVTGAAVASALRESGHEVLEFDLEADSDAFGVLEASGGAEVVFVALHGGAGENGQVQALLELSGLPYVGSGPGACSVAMDKIWTKHLARQEGLLTADWREVSGLDDTALRRAAEDFGYPLVCKPVDEGSAVGVVLAQGAADLDAGLADLGEREGRWMLERYIAGRELTVGMALGEILPVIEIRPKDGFYDYRNKYTAGCTEYDCPAKVDDEITRSVQAAAGVVVQSLRLRDMARLDFRLDEDGQAFFLEANTIPGMTGTSLLPMAAAAAGMDFSTLCERLCVAALGRASA